MSSPKSLSHGENSFDALRLVLALVVVYSHSFAVGGFGNEWTLHYIKGQTTGGSAAVLGFFGISGYLVTKSFCNRPEWRVFIKRRLFRILPGFYFSLFVVSFILSPLIFFFKGDAGSSWRLKEAFDFIWQNALVVIRKWSVGSAVEGLPYNEAINGSLWSLFPEISCYAAVLALGALGFLRKRPELLAVGGFLFLTHTLLIINPTIAVPILPRLVIFGANMPFYISFLVGAAAYLWAGEKSFGKSGAIFWSLCGVFLLRYGGWSIFGPVVFPIALMHCAHSFSFRIPFDLSYGIYLYHFPCFQLAAALRLNQHGYLPFLITGFILTLVLAVISWFLIEKPVLALKAGRKPPVGTLAPGLASGTS